MTAKLPLWLHQPDTEMNKTEARFWTEEIFPPLTTGGLLWAAFEPVSLRLGKRLHYIPDVVAVTDEGQLDAYEVKATWGGTRKDPNERAGWQEDSRVKIKAAATRYPWVNFYGVHRSKRTGQWKYEKFEPEKLPPRASGTP